jgi:hypothetical protein
VNQKYPQPIPCVWCGSHDTWFQAIRYWEQDEQGNEIELDYLDKNLSPRDELWMCPDCDDLFALDFETGGDE